MKKLVLVLCFVLCFASISLGSDFKITPPLTDADGSALDGDLGYNIKCGFTSNSYHITVATGYLTPNAQGDCIFPVMNVIPTDGTWYCRCTAYYMWDPTLESGTSNEIFFVVSGGVIPSVAPGVPVFNFKK